MNLDSINQQLRNSSPTEIIQWALEQDKRVIASTSFGPNSALLLNMIAETAPEVPVIWVDSGYNMRDTYIVAGKIMRRLNLNMHIEVPSVTAERLNAMFGGIPTADEPEEYKAFSSIVKLQPFQKALAKFKPKIWISGIRQSDTDFRKNLDIVSIDHQGIIKVAPIFYWSDQQIHDYMTEQQLPSCRHYFDPTKTEFGRECGLHTAI